MAGIISSAQSLYNDYYEPYATYIAPVRAAFFRCQALFFRVIYPTIYPFWKLANYGIRQLLKNVIDVQTDSPSTDALVSAVALFVVFILSLKVLGFVRRQIMWWISMATTILTWGGMAFVGWHVYTFGVEDSVAAAADLLGMVIGALTGLSQEGTSRGGRLASEREWEAQRIRKQGGRGPAGRSRGGGW